MAAMTDVSTLMLPAAAAASLDAESRTERIDHHGFDLDLSWWNSTISRLQLPGGPVTGRRAGQVVSDGEARVDRGYLFSLAERALGDDGVLRLLWHTLLWGSGSSRRHNIQRPTSVANDVARASDALREAANLARHAPEEAYRRLMPGRKPLIEALGPAFFSKFLYFAGAGAVGHPSPIFDSRVATALRNECGWTSMTTRGGWPPATYARYCSLLSRWAKEQSERLGRQVGLDEMERWLFDVGAP